MTRLSIIIPTYNMEKWLPIALESCLWQSCPDFEVIIINDGSTDSSLDIAAAYAKKDSRISVHSQANAGLGAARQKGQDLAKGDYITWLDADDFLAPQAVDSWLKLARQDKADMICANAVAFSDRTFNARRYFYHPAASKLNFATSPDYWKSKVVWRWIISLPFIHQHNLCHPGFKLGQDVCFMFEALTKASSFSQCQDYVYYFRQEHKSAHASMEVEVRHELGHFVQVKNILLKDKAWIKPFIKYLNENYWRDLKALCPRMQGDDAHYLNEAIALGLELFKGLELKWFQADFLAPELKANSELIPLAEALILQDSKKATDIFIHLRDNPPHFAKKENNFHTLRHRIKAMFNPLSHQARTYLRRLETKAHAQIH